MLLKFYNSMKDNDVLDSSSYIDIFLISLETCSQKLNCLKTLHILCC
jgi:hypothetical protein